MRKRIRLKNFNYSEKGSYYITICLQNRMNILGHVQNKKMILNPLGKIVEDKWKNISKDNQNITLGPYIVMPNHIHGIININVGAIHESPDEI